MPNLRATLLTALLTMLPVSLFAAPTGYSINSDSPNAGTTDSLYRIDLGTGAETRIAAITPSMMDVEGLAFAPDNTLYAVDDQSLTLFPLDTATAAVDTSMDVLLNWLPLGGTNDFGMTFACDGDLYLTSIAQGTLYRVGLDGSRTVIGSEGSLNPIRIVAIAAWGDPVQLYGLGSGADTGGNPETPNLYEISLSTGAATLVGALGGAAGPYTQGGLAFDQGGQLWAITEGAQFDWPSQVMKIDTTTGKASAVRVLSEPGFESLAITAPGGCASGSDSSGSYTNVPTLNVHGLAVAALLLLLTGLFATRRL